MNALIGISSELPRSPLRGRGSLISSNAVSGPLPCCGQLALVKGVMAMLQEQRIFVSASWTISMLLSVVLQGIESNTPIRSRFPI